MEGTHDGHRKRLKGKVQAYGFESLYPHEMLEFILFASIPRKDTNALSHRLIDKFGGYDEVFAADTSALLKVEGVGAASVLQIKSYAYHAQKIMGIANQKRIRNMGEAKDFFASYFEGKKLEEFHVVLLDKAGNAVSHEIYTDRKENRVIVPVDSVMRLVGGANPTFIVFAHNHPSGDANPSEKDSNFTKKMWKNFEEFFGITNCEHLIFAADKCYSFRHNGFFGRN